MKKILIFFLILPILALGCKVDKTIVEDVKEREHFKEQLINGVSVSGNCYLNEELICISATADVDKAIIDIKNLQDKTLFSAYLALGNCRSDSINIETQKIATFVLNNCPNSKEYTEFNLYYLDESKSEGLVNGKLRWLSSQ